MRLYRVIGIEELYKILRYEVVHGRFAEATRDNEYKAEYGPVVCCFTRPVHPSVWDSFIVELDVDESQVVGKGTGRWVRQDSYGNELVIYEPEVYLTHYTPEQVIGIYPLWKDTVIEQYETCFYAPTEPLEDLLFLKQVGVLTAEEELLLDLYLILSTGHPKLRRKDEIQAKLL